MTISGLPGRLIGSGRAADVYELDGGRVLRRYRIPIDAGAEAALMRYLSTAGYPVPEVFDADGRDLVLEHLSGRDMLTDLTRRPWRAASHAATLARLHDRLHEIDAPPGLRQPLGTGTKVVHLDLHPGNVMLTQAGPVVIDWSNGAAGPPGADVAIASLIMRVSTSESASARVTFCNGTVIEGPSVLPRAVVVGTGITGRVVRLNSDERCSGVIIVPFSARATMR